MKSVLAGIEMTEALPLFNVEQKAAGKPEFRIGIGLNYGVVTVGNIGTEKKKEYTVIGPMVDLAEHFEGLTKEYRCPLIVSESLYRKVKDELPCRLLDSVAVSGGTPIRIYTVRRALEPREKEAWGLHNTGMANPLCGVRRGGGLLERSNPLHRHVLQRAGFDEEDARLLGEVRPAQARPGFWGPASSF